MTTITLKSEHYSGGTSYVPVTLEDKYLMGHCLNTDLASINFHSKQKLDVIAQAHGWEVEVV